MKYFVHALVFLTACGEHLSASRAPEPWPKDCTATAILSIEGHYTGRNLCFTNLLVSCSDSRFSWISVTINDTISIPADDPVSSVFEIPLNTFHLQKGDSLDLVVKHYAVSTPRLLQPEVY